MADENNPSTGGTPTTIETTTPPATGLDLGTGQTETTVEAPLAGDTPPKPEDKPAAGAPESYEAWKVPEGYELDAGLVEEATPIFKELNLSQEASQKLVDFYSKHALKAGEQALKAYNDMRAEWRENLKNDSTLSKFADSNGDFSPKSPLVQTINRALDGLENPTLVSDFKAAMDLTGAGDNPAFVRVLHALASKVTEGTSYAQGNPTTPAKGRPSAAAAIFPNLPSQGG